jgi:hypothetical protein
MVKICWLIQPHTVTTAGELMGDAMCGRAFAAGKREIGASRQPGSSNPVIPGIRRAGESELPAAADDRDSTRMVRDARLGSRYRRAVLRRA